jgi:hypothetical protein
LENNTANSVGFLSTFHCSGLSVTKQQPSGKNEFLHKAASRRAVLGASDAKTTDKLNTLQKEMRSDRATRTCQLVENRMSTQRVTIQTLPPLCCTRSEARRCYRGLVNTRNMQSKASTAAMRRGAYSRLPNTRLDFVILLCCRYLELESSSSQLV